jgi:hypothetical protein
LNFSLYPGGILATPDESKKDIGKMLFITGVANGAEVDGIELDSSN